MQSVPLSVITQERLRRGAQLLEQQQRIFEDLQKFKMEIDHDLAQGLEIEAGELTFDRELKIVRTRRTVTARMFEFSAR